jgi:hypothetical protein
MKRPSLEKIAQALPRSRIMAGEYTYPYAEGGPQRRVFYADVGTLPPEAANRFIKSLMEKYDGTS